MARPKSIQNNILEEVVELNAKQFIRVISNRSITDESNNVWNVAEVDAYISKFIDDGYKLANSHYLGPHESGWIMMYVMVKQ